MLQKNKLTDRDRERGVKMNGERDERGEVLRQKEESAGRRRRRGRLKHKEVVVGKTSHLQTFRQKNYMTLGILFEDMCFKLSHNNCHLKFLEMR